MAIMVRGDLAGGGCVIVDAHRVVSAMGIDAVSVDLGLEQDALDDLAVDTLELSARAAF
jgi:hypothetical protein